MVNRGVIRMVLHFRAQDDGGAFGVLQAACNGFGQVVQIVRPSIRVAHVLRQQRHVQFFRLCRQHAHRHAVFRSATQAGGQQRLFFAQHRADHQHGIVVCQLFNRLAEPLRALQAA